MKTSESPYLTRSQRLADVIAGIQVLATYKFYKLDFAGWADRITGDRNQGPHWRLVFEEHPEFFRLDSKRERASLVWRRQHQKLYDVDQERHISRLEYSALNEGQKARVSRTPLDSEEIATLVQAAMNLYDQALRSRKDDRWMTTALLSLLGVVLGAAITGWMKS